MINAPFSIILSLTFYWQLKECLTSPSVECCHKTKIVCTTVIVMHVIDLQTTVTSFVARIYKVVWGWLEVWHRKQPMPARYKPGFRPGDWSYKMTKRIVILALYNYWRPFQSTLIIKGHPPVSTPDTFGKKLKICSWLCLIVTFPHKIW